MSRTQFATCSEHGNKEVPKQLIETIKTDRVGQIVSECFQNYCTYTFNRGISKCSGCGASNKVLINQSYKLCPKCIGIPNMQYLMCKKCGGHEERPGHIERCYDCAHMIISKKAEAEIAQARKVEGFREKVIKQLLQMAEQRKKVREATAKKISNDYEKVLVHMAQTIATKGCGQKISEQSGPKLALVKDLVASASSRAGRDSKGKKEEIGDLSNLLCWEIEKKKEKVVCKLKELESILKKEKDIYGMQNYIISIADSIKLCYQALDYVQSQGGSIVDDNLESVEKIKLLLSTREKKHDSLTDELKELTENIRSGESRKDAITKEIMAFDLELVKRKEKAKELIEIAIIEPPPMYVEPDESLMM